jgi:hypothetical protein
VTLPTTKTFESTFLCLYYSVSCDAFFSWERTGPPSALLKKDRKICEKIERSAK